MQLVIKVIILMVALMLELGNCVSYDVDYCRNGLCPGPPGRINIGCGCGLNTTSYGPNCYGKNAVKIVLDAELKALILREHNIRRNLIACGFIAPHAPAARMVEVTWDDDLQHLAWCNARRCIYGHDQCRSTKDYMYAGQNIASRTICGSSQGRPEDCISTSLHLWFIEHQATTPAMIDKYPGKVPGGPIGHFTVLSNDRVRKIGCSLIVYDDERPGFSKPCRKFNFVCDYSFANIMQDRTYVKSEEPSINCTLHSKQYPCLCSSEEPLLPRWTW